MEFTEQYKLPPEAVIPPDGRANTIECLEIVPSGGPCGAEVKGVDLSRPIPEALAERLRAAWVEHLVLLFRDQKLSQQNYRDAVRLFGEPVANGARHLYARLGDKSLWHVMDYDEVTMLSNLGEDGKPVERNAGLGSLEVVWHSDNSYIETPPAGSTLYAVSIPDDDSGQTSFSNQYMAYEDMPTDLLQAIEGKRAKQDATRNSANVLKPGIEEPTCPEEVPGPMHPLVRVHPVSGRKTLYLGRRRSWPSQYIEGMPNDSEELLDRVWTHATQPKYAWTHHWRVGDFLVWENRSALHRREIVNPTQPRVMWRSQFDRQDVIPG
jgi:taurine dioxygenase